MHLLRYLTFPFAVLYGLITFLYHKLFDSNILKSESFDLPVISIGNLSTGGTGKTPLTEYIIQLLNKDYKVAVLSRGYGRKTKGFRIVNETDTYNETGDEPLQIKMKFRTSVTVAVDEKRANGIKQIQKLFPQIQVVLLDDAFQHRAVKPKLSLMLSSYSKPYFEDFMLPVGNLREYKSGSKRADAIIITKTPGQLSEKEKQEFISQIKPFPHQKVLFSYLKYGSIVPFNSNSEAIQKIDKSFSILLFSGIANNEPLVKYVRSLSENTVVMEFGDHHGFSAGDVEKIKNRFNVISHSNKIILTTEKDAIRLCTKELLPLVSALPIYYITIEPGFDESDERKFREMVMGVVRV